MKKEELVIRHPWGEEKYEWILHEPTIPNRHARLAMSLIERWGMVAARIDEQEDSAGRSKLALLTPAEVVERACTTAQLALSEFEKLGWLIEMPSHQECVEIAKEQKEALK